MPYRSYDELIADVEDNPKLAKLRVAKAKQSGIPIVNEKNSGYKSKAVAKRMQQGYSQKQNKYTNKTLTKRMTSPKIESDEEDETVSKRKRVGY